LWPSTSKMMGRPTDRPTERLTDRETPTCSKEAHHPGGQGPMMVSTPRRRSCSTARTTTSTQRPTSTTAATTMTRSPTRNPRPATTTRACVVHTHVCLRASHRLVAGSESSFPQRASQVAADQAVTTRDGRRSRAVLQRPRRRAWGPSPAVHLPGWMETPSITAWVVVVEKRHKVK